MLCRKLLIYLIHNFVTIEHLTNQLINMQPVKEMESKLPGASINSLVPSVVARRSFSDLKRVTWAFCNRVAGEAPYVYKYIDNCVASYKK